ncbi:MAG: hypothetical protein KKD99_09075, partial [Proteobacteria bacterium]|nr:hypothetical protein [Pseudomonadota bacterium]
KLNFIFLEDRHGVASLQTLNQSSLAFPSPFEGKVPGEVNKLLTVYFLLSLPLGKEEINYGRIRFTQVTLRESTHG